VRAIMNADNPTQVTQNLLQQLSQNDR
jgi:thiamine monophosphate synthase